MRSFIRLYPRAIKQGRVAGRRSRCDGPGCDGPGKVILGRPGAEPETDGVRGSRGTSRTRSGPGPCPNLPQRPQSSRGAQEESLIFRAFLRGRSRPGAPLWQIWTRPPPRIIPGATPAPSHARSSPTPRRPRPLSRQSCEVRLNEPFSSGESSSGVLRGDAGRSRRSLSPARTVRCELSSLKSTSARTM